MAQKCIHEVLPVGLLQCNCSIIGDPATREAIVIDPGDEVERILDILRRHELKVQAILSTHTHIDHVGGLALLHEKTGAPILMHEQDFPLYRLLDAQAQWLGVPTPPVASVDSFVKEGDVIRWGGFQASVLHTPGHSPGSISLYIPSSVGPPKTLDVKQGEESDEAGRLIAGDTLFAGSIGRTDLWGGSFEQIMRSLKGKLLPLPDETIVYPGHGEVTTIGRERESNPFLRPD